MLRPFGRLSLTNSGLRGNVTHLLCQLGWALEIQFNCQLRGHGFWGRMIGLVTPYNKGLMIAFTFLEQTFFGWAQYEPVAFTLLGTFTGFDPQFPPIYKAKHNPGVKQIDLGISGGLAGVGR
jgi:hypothetical protein